VTLSREERFATLVEAVQSCTLCRGISGRRKILSRRNGSLHAKIMFVAEAPGRLGADRTGVPLLGDKAGANFQTLLHHIGLPRARVFVTNAVLCNPRTSRGNNRAPTRAETANCAEYLRRTIDLVRPDVVVALGALALASLRLIALHEAVLKSDAATAIPWYDRVLVPLYHPGSRALIHRPLERQKRDYEWLKDLLRSLDHPSGSPGF
jgi:uracil-DNA glycosylase family 4